MPRVRLSAALGPVLVASLLPVAAAQSPAVPPLLTAALSPSADETLYAYEFTMTETGSRNTTVRGRIDPTKPEGQRVEIIEGNGKDLDLEAMDERLEDNADGDIWCDSMISGASGKIAEIGSSSGNRAYRFTPRARPEAGKDERKMFDQLVADTVVDEDSRTLKSFSARLEKPWKPNIAAKIHEFNMSGECALAPNGRAYARTITTQIRGSALGQNFNAKSVREITSLAPAG